MFRRIDFIIRARPISYRSKLIEDLDIIAQIRLGKKEAFAELVRRYEQKIRRYCQSMLGDAASAEDAAQEVFIKAFQALSRFRGDATFATWLYRIAANHCRDILRKRKREKTQSWEALVDAEGSKIEALFALSPDLAIPLESLELLTKVLSYLPENYRSVLVLREMHGLSYQELSEALGCSVDAVKGRLNRARNELESKLRHFLDTGDVNK